jgi:hypothetical protein
MRDDLTQIALILDRSGSMSSIANATVGGVNSFMNEQRNAPGSAALLFVQFDDLYEQVYDGDIKNAPVLTLAGIPAAGEHRFEPRGWTALRDAIGTTIEDLGKRLAAMPEQDRPGKVVVVIMTDGMENRSKRFNRSQIAQMIAQQRDVYKWQFQYLGANQDAIKEAQNFSISADNAVTFAATSRGAANVMRAMSSNVSSYRISGQTASLHYSAEERAKAVEQDDMKAVKP